MKLLTVAALLFALGCSGGKTPTTPTPVAVVPPVVDAISDLRWDIFAPDTECVISKPVPNLTDAIPEYRRDIPGGVRALYLQSVVGPRQTYIGGDFKRLGTIWALCSWDTYIRDSMS